MAELVRHQVERISGHGAGRHAYGCTFQGSVKDVPKSGFLKSAFSLFTFTPCFTKVQLFTFTFTVTVIPEMEKKIVHLAPIDV